MPSGRGLGIALVLIGILVTIIAWVLVQVNGSLPRIFVGGPALAILGLAMMLLPGSRDVPASDHKAWLRASPWSHKLVWILAGAAGLYLGFRYLLGWAAG